MLRNLKYFEKKPPYCQDNKVFRACFYFMSVTKCITKHDCHKIINKRNLDKGDGVKPPWLNDRLSDCVNVGWQNTTVSILTGGKNSMAIFVVGLVWREKGPNLFMRMVYSLRWFDHSAVSVHVIINEANASRRIKRSALHV